MAKYVVIKDFTDAMDGGHIYRAGDEFPRSGAVVSKDRVSGLLGTKNGRGVPLIRESFSVDTGDALDAGAGESPSKSVKTERKPKKGQKKDA